jgi:hypothetical protein
LAPAGKSISLKSLSKSCPRAFPSLAALLDSAQLSLVPPDGRQPARRAGYDVVPIDRRFRQNDLTMRWLRNGSLGAHEYQRTEIEVLADAPACSFDSLAETGRRSF